MSARTSSFSAALVLVALAVAAPADAGLMGKLKKVKDARDKSQDLNAKITPEQERSLGRGVAANLIGRYGLVDDAELVQYVATVGTWLVSRSSQPEMQAKFAILDSDEVNAFATPGGYVFLTRGAVHAAQDESELASLLAHEVLHLTERHGVKSIEDAYRKQVVMSGLAEKAAERSGVDPGLLEAFGKLTGQLSDTLLNKGYERKQELQADDGAVRLLAAAGYDPEALVRYLDRLESPQQSGKMASLKSTHPPASDRAKAARKVLSDANLATQPSARFEQLFAAAIQ